MRNRLFAVIGNRISLTAILLLVSFNIPPIFIRESGNVCITYIMGAIVGILGIGISFDRSTKDVRFGLISGIFILLCVLFSSMMFFESMWGSLFINCFVLIGYFKFMTHDQVKITFFLFTKLALVLIFGIMLLQYLDIFRSLHAKFDVTGFFFNPNQLAIYIGALTSILITKTYVDFKGSLFDNKLMSILILLGVLSLILLRCRSAYIGMFVVLIFVFSANIYRLSKGYALLIVPILASLFYYMYKIKSTSADGRLFIWRLSLRILKENLPFGVGTGNFQINFREKQASFFQNMENVLEYGKFAGQIDYAFCDLLQFFIEYGIFLGLGVLIFIAFSNYKIISLIKTEKTNSVLISSYMGLVFLVTSSLTNYVFYVPQLRLLAEILIAILLTFETNKISIKNKLVKWTIASISVLIIVQSAIFLHATKKYHVLKKSRFRFSNKISLVSLSHLYPVLKGNPRFLCDLAIVNYKFNETDISRSISYLEESRRVYLHGTNTTVLAEYFLRNNEQIKTEELYITECYANALRGTSYYLLLHFYFRTRQKEKFNNWYAKGEKTRLSLSPWEMEQLEIKYKFFNFHKK